MIKCNTLRTTVTALITAIMAGIATQAVGNPPAPLTLQNSEIRLTFHPADGSLEVNTMPDGKLFQTIGSSLKVITATANESRIQLRLSDPASSAEFSASFQLVEHRREFVVTLQGSGPMPRPLDWPGAFRSTPGEMLIVPVNEGISYPVDDATLPEMFYHLYGGHGLCMPWYGATNGASGWMAIVETPDDAEISIKRRNHLLGIAPLWFPQKGKFGPERTVRFVLFNEGGYVAMAKRYREFAKQTGLFKTLAEKREKNPHVDRLIGAVNVYCWDRMPPEVLCREMQEAGIERILWSFAWTPPNVASHVKALNARGVLTSLYDIYQDAMNPAEFPKLQHISSFWTSDAWKNDDLMIRADGSWQPGWEVDAKDGTRVPCGTLCDRQALAYARRRMPDDLKVNPWGARFLDTTTASEWRECYHPKHPMTRSESKRYKMELLKYVSDDLNLVCGSETGHDAAVPYVHYFEGMLSLGPYRIPDAGRSMWEEWQDVPADLEKFQTGHFYRLPLWELVYHDCVIAQWYWGDYNHKLPKLWDRRDLWNALYGTPPMFMFFFDWDRWRSNKERFVKSYQTATPVARATATSEMLSHEWLTKDRAVQRTRFANGVSVTANFGEAPFVLPDGTSIPSLGHRVNGLPTANDGGKSD